MVSGEPTVRVEIWSDIVCPWCYIGKRRFERALEGFAHADRVRVQWRSFELDPSFPAGGAVPVLDALARKTGASREQVAAMTDQVREVAAGEGLVYDLEGGVMVNTFDVHRLVHLAREAGVEEEAQERFMRAQLVEARDLSQEAVLVELSGEIGLDADRVREVLSGDRFAAQVRDEADQARRLGGTGVPFFVFDRALGVAGAQPVEVFSSALEKAWQTRS
nr:DsbA family oxidoreductase [Nocardiopsis algeriensis]